MSFGEFVAQIFAVAFGIITAGVISVLFVLFLGIALA